MLLLRYRTRKIVFRSLFVLYFFVAAWLLLFANGYRVKPNPFTISRTGNILATYEPKKAVVAIDGFTAGDTSPARVRSLFPGVHDISITADGYIPYQRAVRIEPHKTSFVSNIFLLRDAQPELTQHIAVAPTVMPEQPITTIADHAVTIVNDTVSGARIIVDNKPATRDLGNGGWKIAGGDANVLALARTDINEIQFRSWNNLDTVVTTLPGKTVVNFEFDGSSSLLSVSTFELWNFNTDNKTAELLYRFSKPISQILAVPDTTTILVVLADEIVAFHLGDHHYIPTTIARAPRILNARITDNGTELFYTVEESGSFAEYRRRIQ